MVLAAMLVVIMLDACAKNKRLNFAKVYAIQMICARDMLSMVNTAISQLPSQIVHLIV